MIVLSSIVKAFGTQFLKQYRDSILPSHRKAPAATKWCRVSGAPLMQIQCTECDSQHFVPHSCGHRFCPHCRYHESQQ